MFVAYRHTEFTVPHDIFLMVMKMLEAVFCAVALCSLVGRYQRLRGLYQIHPLAEDHITSQTLTSVGYLQ